MGHCKDCKYWEAHFDGRKTWHTCEGADCATYDQKIFDDSFAIYAEALDDSGLQYGLKTGPMFGCIKFEQKVEK